MKSISDRDPWWININQSVKNYSDETTPVIEMIEKKVDNRIFKNTYEFLNLRTLKF